ncbi:hypothetical protein AIOL_001838 [Candidatus Rhodobacter oscarellae]|uniref:Uncharacterized protein n=1 Tax=Candidatus Rhodobacter oscarellae TaxID=1675527 RepID=A0A0J9E1W5_9RHOB|nr:hypothetical protein [Candidatus Rhodobacter lobularis]KMW56881.1 hypothetical protein AIOL_001838 [Candidatus Rhodobacter lobularis]
MHPAIKYGLTTFVAVFFVGWVTGLGGAFLTNLAFSAAMGAFSSLCFLGAMRLSRRQAKKNEEDL